MGFQILTFLFFNVHKILTIYVLNLLKSNLLLFTLLHNIYLFLDSPSLLINNKNTRLNQKQILSYLYFPKNILVSRNVFLWCNTLE